MDVAHYPVVQIVKGVRLAFRRYPDDDRLS
jgi:hypothetical protein